MHPFSNIKNKKEKKKRKRKKFGNKENLYLRDFKIKLEFYFLNIIF